VTHFNGFAKYGKISKCDRALLKILRQAKNWILCCWWSVPRRIGPGQVWTDCWGKLIPLAWLNVWKAVVVRDKFARWYFWKHRSCSGAFLQSWKSVRNWKGDRHFTVVWLAHSKARSSSWKPTSACQGYCHSL